jgi:tetratricopeptide (TPR) repeat protein
VDLSQRLAEEFPDRTEYRVDLAQDYMSLGFILGYTRSREAEEAYREALALLKQAVAGSPGVPEYRSTLANVYNNLGILLSGLKRTGEAEGCYRQAQEIWQELAAVDPQEPKYQGDLGGTFDNLGLILMYRGERSRVILGASTVCLMASAPAQGPLLAASALIPARVEDLPRARQFLRQAIDHQHRALKVLPFNTQDRAYLARHYDVLGAIEKRLNDYDEAEKAIRQSQAVRQRLADDFPSMPGYRSELGGVLNNLVIIQKHQGKFAEARRSIEEAITHQQAALKMDAEGPLYRQFLRNHYVNLADILVEQGEHAEAVRAAAKVAGVFPDDGEDQTVAAWHVARCIPLVEKDAGLPGEKRRELAQAYADQAMRYLRDGIAKGGADAAFIRTDPGFGPLRARADYKDLVAGLEAKTKPAPK